MQHRQIHVLRAARLEHFGELAHQRLADARRSRLRIDGETPQRGTAFGIPKGAAMVDAHHGAENGAADRFFGHQMHESAAVAMGPEEIGPHRHHLARGVDAVDFLGVELRRHAPDRQAARPTAGAAVVAEIETESMRGIEEQFLRRTGQHDVRFAHVEGDVALVGLFVAQRIGQRAGIVESLPEQQTAPAAVDFDVMADFFRARVVAGRTRQRLAGRVHVQALDAMGDG